MRTNLFFSVARWNATMSVFTIDKIICNKCYNPARWEDDTGHGWCDQCAPDGMWVKAFDEPKDGDIFLNV